MKTAMAFSGFYSVLLYFGVQTPEGGDFFETKINLDVSINAQYHVQSKSVHHRHPHV